VSQTLHHSLKSVFAVNLPASAGLIFLGYPIVEMLFQYGRFYTEDTHATAKALAMYSVGLTAYSSVKVLVPACYALGNTRIPVISSVLSVFITIFLNLILLGPLGFQGLALGTSMAAIFNAAFLLGSVRSMLQKQKGSLDFSPLVRSFFAYLAVALLMGGVCALTNHGIRILFSDYFFLSYLGRFGLVLGRGIKVGVLIMEGVGIFWLGARMFQLVEANEILDIFGEKLKNKLRRKPT